MVYALTNPAGPANLHMIDLRFAAKAKMRSLSLDDMKPTLVADVVVESTA